MSYDDSQVYGDMSAIHMVREFGAFLEEPRRREEPRATTQPLDYVAEEAPAFGYSGRPGRGVAMLREMAASAATVISNLRRPAKVHDDEFIGDTLMLDRHVA